ncbi:GxxExxY protein [Mangrovibacterium marinum]|uniref:GxxExxY protein n=1 Tax=Mangrovibacterium marinum TaxID=1639118 RepID=UPI002A188BAB|nr:GxxExxY protein [Mangrovibacterium marinum]
MDLLEHSILYPKESYKIIGACMEVHKTLGCGFLEAVYQEALALEFKSRGIPFEQEPLLEIVYKGQTLNKTYKADFICFDQIIIELKALNKLSNEHIAQTLNYLKATDYKLGLLVNFGTTSLQYKRVVL